jgi:hypothetical protein
MSSARGIFPSWNLPLSSVALINIHAMPQPPYHHPFLTQRKLLSSDNLRLSHFLSEAVFVTPEYLFRNNSRAGQGFDFALAHLLFTRIKGLEMSTRSIQARPPCSRKEEGEAEDLFRLIRKFFCDQTLPNFRYPLISEGDSQSTAASINTIDTAPRSFCL